MMNYEKWQFHDVSPINLQLVHKLQYAILSGEIRSIGVYAKFLRKFHLSRILYQRYWQQDKSTE